MKEIIDNLKANEIIYQQSIDILKNYIQGKYPDQNESYRARVFADAVHKILDDHVKEFRRDDQRAIKKSLLTSAVDNNSFEINAYDIMKTCVNLNMDDKDFLDDLGSWLNHQQDIPIKREALRDLTDIVKEEIQIEAGVTEEESTYLDDIFADAYDNLDELIESATLGSNPITNESVDDAIEDVPEEAPIEDIIISNQFEADLMAQLEAAFEDTAEELLLRKRSSMMRQAF